MPKFEVVLSTKTFYRYIIEAPNSDKAKEIALKSASVNDGHAEDPSDEQAVMHFEGGRALPEGDDAAVDFGSDEPRV